MKDGDPLPPGQIKKYCNHDPDHMRTTLVFYRPKGNGGIRKILSNKLLCKTCKDVITVGLD